ncbi:MAG TPA: GNAT family N-acetyltransferase, partial [Thermoanaerobaculia bacterium]|nr:GNAT family N-acetyltransferase [Thermoanaerobaculia bacterium]
MDLESPAEPLPPELASLLPAAGARLALIPAGAEPAAELLHARGFATAPLGAEPAAIGLPAAPVVGGWDAIVVLAEPAGAALDFPPLLASARAALAERGQLFIAGTFAATVADGAIDSRALVVALSEAGFVVLRQQSLGTEGSPPRRELLTARRDAFRVREYRPGDEVQILPIFEGSFFVKRSLERWSWEYRENPYDNLEISAAFAEDGQLVAHYAGFPVRFRLAGRAEPVTALHIGDTMTLPGVRHVGRGPTSLLGRTVRHFYARFCEGRVAFNYGINT